MLPNIRHSRLKDHGTGKDPKVPGSSTDTPTEHVPAPVEWAQSFTDPRLSAAIVDRLTYNAHIITTGTGSYRLRSATARQAAAKTAGRDAKEKGTPA